MGVITIMQMLWMFAERALVGAPSDQVANHLGCSNDASLMSSPPLGSALGRPGNMPCIHCRLSLRCHLV